MWLSFRYDYDRPFGMIKNDVLFDMTDDTLFDMTQKYDLLFDRLPQSASQAAGAEFFCTNFRHGKQSKFS